MVTKGGFLAAYLISSGLSLLGTCYTLYVSSKAVHKSPVLWKQYIQLRLLVYLAIVDFFAALIHFIPTWAGPYSKGATEFLCTSQAIGNQFFFLSSFCWIAAIAINQYRTKVRNDRFPEKYEVLYHIVAWGLPGLTLIFMLSARAQGPTDNGNLWCWIKPDYQSLIWGLFYVPLLIVIGLIILLYGRVLKVLYEAQSQTSRVLQESLFLYDRYSAVSDLYARPRENRASSIRFNIFLFIVAFVIIRFPSVLDRFVELVTRTNSPDAIALLHAMTAPLQGFVNGILFWRSEFVTRFVTTPRYRRVTDFENGNDDNRRDKNAQARRVPPNEVARFSLGSKDQFDSIVGGVTILIITWNSAGVNFGEGELKYFFSNLQLEKFDLVVFGMQECKKENWVQVLTSNMQDFKPAYSDELGAVKLGIWSSEKRFSVVSSQTRRESTGIGNVLKNKGGVAARIGLRRFEEGAFPEEYSFCFICAHLAAHMNQVQERNQDVYQIFGRLKFDGLKLDEVVKRCDATFFFGDLNYRIERSVDEILEAVEEKRWDDLTENDQLIDQMRQRVVFCGFREGELEFPPTFKRIPDSTEIKYSRKREPAWCDRILYANRGHIVLQQLFYTSVDELVCSDHRAVSSALNIMRSPELKFDLEAEVFIWEVSFAKMEIEITDSDPDLIYPSELYAAVHSEFSNEPYISQIATRAFDKFVFSVFPSVRFQGDVTTFRKANVVFVIKDHSLMETDDVFGIAALDFFGIPLDDDKLLTGEHIEQTFALKVSKLSKRVAVLVGVVNVRRRGRDHSSSRFESKSNVLS